MATIRDTLDSIISQAVALKQLLDEGDTLEDTRTVLERIDSDLDDALEQEPVQD